MTDDPTNLTLDKLTAAMALLPEPDPALLVAIRMNPEMHYLLRRRFAPKSPKVGLGFGGIFVGVRLYIDPDVPRLKAVPMDAEQERAWLAQQGESDGDS